MMNVLLVNYWLFWVYSLQYTAYQNVKDHREKTTDDRPRTTDGKRQPTTDHRPPMGKDNRRPTDHRWEKTTDDRPPTTDHGPPNRKNHCPRTTEVGRPWSVVAFPFFGCWLTDVLEKVAYAKYYLNEQQNALIIFIKNINVLDKCKNSQRVQVNITLIGDSPFF